MVGMVRIRGVRVDIEAIARLAHRCDPSRCTHAKTCCATYDVRVEPHEEKTITGILPLAAKYQPAIRDADGYAEVFDEDDDGTSLATHDDGRCVFAFRGSDRGVRCALHAAALEAGADPYRTKPMPCALWPLALSEGPDPILTVMAGSRSFPCNRSRGLKPSIHPGVAEILSTCFGGDFRADVEAAASKLNADH